MNTGVNNQSGPELICPAGSLPALRSAIDNGADAVYCGFRDNTNARNFPGLNFGIVELTAGLKYAHTRGRRLLLAANTYPTSQGWTNAVRAVDRAADLGVDALILADIGLMEYASRTYPNLRLHLSVQGSATNRHAIRFYYEHFGIQRAILPRVLSLAQVVRLVDAVPVELEVFGFGSLCIMVEGRCLLSSYVTGDSPNTAGVCSPAHAVRWCETPSGRESWLNDILIDRFAETESAGYPTLCKGRFSVNSRVFHAIEEPTSLNVLTILPDLVRAGVAAIKVEGRQRSPAYVARVTAILRRALDRCAADPEAFEPAPEWIDGLNSLSEGSCHTLGAYHRNWQ